MPIHAPKILVFGAKIGEGIFGFRPQPNQFVRFRPKGFYQISWRSVEKCDRKRAHTHTHTHTHTQTKKTDLIICPMLWYSNGTDNYAPLCRPMLYAIGLVTCVSRIHGRLHIIGKFYCTTFAFLFQSLLLLVFVLDFFVFNHYLFFVLVRFGFYYFLVLVFVN